MLFEQALLIERRYHMEAAKERSDRVLDAGRVLELELFIMKLLFMWLKMPTTEVSSRIGTPLVLRVFRNL
ncbi:hypothetical protein D6B98_37980 [Bradyrhizobium sp. LVM 105]|nr:hypothetical protein D6B98_37980 [Bradyrhizobium sp. LVM 105]